MLRDLFMILVNNGLLMSQIVFRIIYRNPGIVLIFWDLF